MTVFGNLIVVVAALALARRNLRLGRSDTAGALRIACFFLVVRMVATLLSAHHVPSPPTEARILRGPLARDLWGAVQVWVFYVALEPFARRRWPHTLISWSRLLKGRVSDPLVGRDWLFGAICGTVMGLVWHLTYLAPAVLGLPSPAPSPNGVWLLNHVSYGLSQLADILANSVEGSLLALFLLSLFRMALRRDGLAILALLGTHIIFNLWWLPGRNQALEMVFLTAIFALWAFTLVRFGLLALLAATLFLSALRLTPVALDPGAWYGAQAPIVLTLLGATATYAFRVSLAGRPALGSRFLDD